MIRTASTADSGIRQESERGRTPLCPWEPTDRMVFGNKRKKSEAKRS